MGVNNRARRAVKKRKRSARQRVRDAASAPPAECAHEHPPGGAGPTDRDLAERLVAEGVKLCAVDLRMVGPLADRMLVGAAAGHLSADAIGAAVERLLRQVARGVTRAGWGPRDLTELVRRRLTPEHLPLLVAALHRDMGRHPAERVAPAWRAELAALGTAEHPPVNAHQGLALVLGLVATLSTTPRVPRLLAPPGDADPLDGVTVATGGRDAKVLAKVRALLAKAESTEYAEEAEALSAKAQELISRYSLDRLIAAVDRSGTDGTAILARRFWLDAPYVSAKASLVAAVARANRCSTVSTEKLGFTTVAGTASDLDAVELLTTSLMVQADTAMFAAGRRTDRYGTSRTASYRRSFLLAYAHRVGERLTAADQAVSSAFAASAGGGALVPVLRDHGERVDAALAQMFPDVVYKRASISNWHGWVEGRAAADLARLDRHRQIDA